MLFTDKQFTSVLENSNYQFKDQVVTAQFNNEFFYLDATLDFPNCTFEIEFYVQDNEVKLTEKQEAELESFCKACYNENIADWQENNAHDLKQDFRLHRSDARREESKLNR